MRTDEVLVMHVLSLLLVSTVGLTSGVSDMSEVYRLNGIPDLNATIYGLNLAAPLRISEKDWLSTIKQIDVELLGNELIRLASMAMENLSSVKFPSYETLKTPAGFGIVESQMPVSHEDINITEYTGAGSGDTIPLPEHVMYRSLPFREISDGYRESGAGVDVVWNFS